MIAEGIITAFVSGVNSLLGLVSGLILGALIMFYLLKDGTALRRNVVASIDPSIRDDVDDFIRDAVGSSVTTGEVAPSCPPLSPWSSASRASCSASTRAHHRRGELHRRLPIYIGAFLGGGLA